MTAYMNYQGRAVEVSGWIAKGQRVPRLYPGDRGEQPGDFAVIDDEMMRWDGTEWVATSTAPPLLRVAN